VAQFLRHGHCNCRVRIGTAARCRKPCPSCVTAFEKIVRGYAENPSENVIVPILGASFDSLGEAYDFYNLYSWERGFGIRYKKSRVNVERMKGMQEIVCGCSVCAVGSQHKFFSIPFSCGEFMHTL
jgi:hypothetical protein